MSTVLYPSLNAGGVVDAICNYPTTSSGLENGVMKPAIYTMDWMEIAGVRFSPEACAAKQTLKDAKNILIGTSDLLATAGNFKDHAYKVICGYGNERSYALADAGFDLVDAVNPVADIVQFGLDKGLVELKAETISALNLAGNVALVVGPGRQAVLSAEGILHEGNEIERASTLREQMVHQAKSVRNWLDLLKYISYVALGAINLIGFIFSIPIQPWVALACVTSALVFTLGSYFHTQLSILRNL